MPLKIGNSESTMLKLTIVGLIFTALGLALAFAAWQFPKSSGAPPIEGGAPTGGAVGQTNAAPPTTSAPAAEAVAYVDSISPIAGTANLVPARRQPAAVTGAGHPHAVVISCPTNQADDKVREVTYELRGRFRMLSATVRPHYDKYPDSVTYVTAVAGFPQRDGVLSRREVGRQQFATMASPQALAAEVHGADQITIQVQCESPDGVVVLENARLTRS